MHVSFKLLLSAVVHFDMEVQQMDVKTTFCMVLGRKLSIWIIHKDKWIKTIKKGLFVKEVIIWFEAELSTVGQNVQ